MDQLQMNQSAGVEVVKLPLRGKFHVDHLRDGKVINSFDFNNDITTEGKNFLLDVMFHNTTAYSTWYIGLVDNTGFSAYAAADTYDNINQPGNGWDEFTTYTDGNNGDSTTTRPEWKEATGGASSGSLSTQTTAIFNITSAGTVKGVFVCGGANAQTKSDDTATGNKLWAAANFTGGNVSVVNTDQLKVTYTVSC